MKKALFIWAIIFSTCSAGFSQSKLPSHIYFKSGSDQLSLKSKAKLDRFCKDLLIQNPFLLEIVGHTDDVGKDEANIDLALRRAQRTKSYLVEKGVEAERIVLAALGEAQPLFSNEKESGRKQNRRVSFALGDGTFAWIKSASHLVYQNKEQLETLAELEVKDLNPREKLFNSLLRSLDKPGQKFRINTRIESHVKGKEGTLIYIPKGVFETEDGSTMTEDVHIVLNEYYSRSDMILGNLNSMSSNGLLESGGMLNIQAFSGDKKLRLKEGRKLEVYIPTEKVKEGMQLFTANSAANRELISDFWSIDTSWNIPDPSRIDSVENTWYLNKQESRNWKEILDDPNLLFVNSDTVWQNDIPVIMDQEAYLRKRRAIPSVLRLKSKDDLYLFNAAKLGWINCDRFMRDARPKTELLVKRDQERPRIVRLIFKDINALMSGTYIVDDYLCFPNLPLNQQVLAVVIAKGEGEDEFEYGIKEVRVKKDLKIDEISMTVGSEVELKEYLAAALE